MAYENVNITKLKSALTDCLNTLDYKLSNSIIEGLTDDVWSGKAKANLVTALSKIIDDYKEIEEKINSYLATVSAIENYQNSSNNITTLKNSKSLKEQELIKEKNKKPLNTTKINSLQKEIDSLNAQINEQQNALNNISVNI